MSSKLTLSGGGGEAYDVYSKRHLCLIRDKQTSYAILSF